VGELINLIKSEPAVNTVAVRQDGVNLTQNGDFDLGESRNRININNSPR